MGPIRSESIRWGILEATGLVRIFILHSHLYLPLPKKSKNSQKQIELLVAHSALELRYLNIPIYCRNICVFNKQVPQGWMQLYFFFSQKKLLLPRFLFVRPANIHMLLTRCNNLLRMIARGSSIHAQAYA